LFLEDDGQDGFEDGEFFEYRYQVITKGWQGTNYVHDCPMHFDIIDGKIWIQ
jgi:hypothetical protein